MAGPWEKYSQSSDDSDSASDSTASGPWSKYGGQSDSGGKPDFFSGATKSAIDSLPMVGGVAGGILGTPADALTGPAGTIGGAAIGGYLGTATKNLINKYYDPESAPKTTAQAITQPVVGGVEQGLMQGTGEAVTPYIAQGVRAAVGAGSDAAKWAGTKALSSIGGVKPDVISEYAQFSKRINSAPSVDALKNISDDFVSKLADDVTAKKITQEQAQAAYSGLQSDLKDAYRTAGYDARDAVTSAQQTLKDAHGARLQQLSGDVYDSVNKLRSDVTAGSDKALDVLDKSGITISPKPVYDTIDSTIAKLKKGGTDESLAVADKLAAYKQRMIENSGPMGLPAPDAKILIKDLDKTTKYSGLAGAFDDVKNAAFKDVRSTLDQTLKDAVPDYKKAMLPVAADSDLLSRLKPFADKQSGINALSRISAPNQMESRAALDQLGKKYGADFVAGAQPENLPEHALLQKAQAAQSALRPDQVASKIDQTLGASRQKAALDASQSGLEQSKQSLAPFKPLAPNIADQTQAQQKLMQLGQGKNIELTDMFQKLGKLTNTDFVQAMKDQNTLAAFQKGATNGSRNSLLGLVAGTVFGGLGTGSAVGLGAGRVIDQWGPAITKKILDGAIKVANSPTVATISKLELPDAIKRNMVMGLENYMAKDGARVNPGSALQNVAGSDKGSNRTPSGEDRWAQSGLSNLGMQDHPAAQSLLSNPKTKQLLIQASDLKPGSKAMQKVNDQIQQLLKGAK